MLGFDLASDKSETALKTKTPIVGHDGKDTTVEEQGANNTELTKETDGAFFENKPGKILSS